MKFVVSAVVDLYYGTFLIIPDVTMKISPDFQSTETAFKRCSTKGVVQAVMRYNYSTFVLKSLEKYLLKAIIFRKVASL